MRREQRERIGKRDMGKAEVQTPAQQMMAGWFGGRLDAFLGFAGRAPAHRGPTPKRTTRPRDGGTGVPYERPERDKHLSQRDWHRMTVRLARSPATQARPVADFFRTKQAMRLPPRRPLLRGASFSLPHLHEKLL